MDDPAKPSKLVGTVAWVLLSLAATAATVGILFALRDASVGWKPLLIALAIILPVAPTLWREFRPTPKSDSRDDGEFTRFQVAVIGLAFAALAVLSFALKRYIGAAFYLFLALVAAVGFVRRVLRKPPAEGQPGLQRRLERVFGRGVRD